MKSIKVGSQHKLVPKKSYVYYDVISSLQNLLNKPGFLASCEKWRERQTSPGWLSDVYDGRLWNEWMNFNGVPFLSVPGNLALMINLDWFQPYDHTQYSIGVMYIVVQNLPREERFKPENILIVSTIPGAKEPSCSDLNFYLQYLVNDLLRLRNGIDIQISSIATGLKRIRAALLYISVIFQQRESCVVSVVSRLVMDVQNA